MNDIVKTADENGSAKVEDKGRTSKETGSRDHEGFSLFLRKEDLSLEELFLYELFPELPPGVIYQLVIEDKIGGKVLLRNWFKDKDELIHRHQDISEYAENNNAAFYVGVLLRYDDSSGEGKNTIRGHVAWADLDYKDYQGGEEECRQRLESFPLPPSAVNFTGHGLQAFWFFKKLEEPEVLVYISAGLAKVLNGDSVADAARLIRVPGSSNMKDPANPILAVVEKLNPDLRYSPSNFDDFFPPMPEKPRKNPQPEIDEQAAEELIGEELSERVKKLIDEHPRTKNLFNGQGKPAKDDQGRRLDHSSSGFDYSLMLSLIKKGITNESELATALWHRPDDAARSKGIKYIMRTVSKALDQVAEQGTARGKKGENSSDEEDEGPKFIIEKVRIYSSVPAIYELTINGAPVKFSARELLSKGSFKARFLDALHFVPALPKKNDDWDALVNSWMTRAEVIEQPPEASEAGLLKEHILSAIENLAIGESVLDLDRMKALQHDTDGQVFKIDSLMQVLKDRYGEVRPHVLCGHLHDLGYNSQSRRFGAEVTRAWGKTQAVDAPDTDQGQEV